MQNNIENQIFKLKQLNLDKREGKNTLYKIYEEIIAVNSNGNTAVTLRDTLISLLTINNRKEEYEAILKRLIVDIEEDNDLSEIYSQAHRIFQNT